MRDGFEIRRALGRPLAGAQPPANGFFEKPRFGQMVGEQLGLGRGILGEIGFEHGGDAGVKFLAATA